MRIFFATLALLSSAAMLTVGILQRTLWLGPDAIVETQVISSAAPYTVIETSALNLNPGNKTLTVSGDGNVFAAYASVQDIHAWLGEDAYNKISAVDGEIILTENPPKLLIDEDGNSITAPRPEIVNPAGSDLWLEEYSQPDTLALKMSPSTEIAVLVASDGIAPSASQVSISWALDNSTPMTGPLVVGGILLFLIGIYLMIKSFRRNKRSTNKNKYPKPPKLQKATKQKSKYVAPKRGRRAAGKMVAVGVTGLLLFSGCSPQYWPDFSGNTPTNTAPAMETVHEEPVTDRVLSILQIERILGRVAGAISQSNSDRNTKALSERLEGAELRVRSANLKARLADSKIEETVKISTNDPQLVLPQVSDYWPKSLFLVQAPADEKSSSVMLVLRQNTPRENYMLLSSVELNNLEARFPDVAPANKGTTIVPNDSKLLAYEPGMAATAYADILINGEDSEYYTWFGHSGDLYLSNFGPDYKLKRQQDRNISNFATIKYSSQAGEEALAISTLNEGALAVINVEESETLTPKTAYDKILPQGQVAALFGKAETSKKLTTTYSVKLLIYIPPASIGGVIQVLGSSWGITDVKEG